MSTVQTDIQTFQVDIPDEKLADLRRRISATRWPTKELVDDRSQGVQLKALQELSRYWETDYDWRKAEAKLNALPQFTTEIDGIEIHFIHVKSEHEDALPLIMTHGWPGSVIELLETIGPLTDPTAHGGTAEDAFDLVLPSVPGYGFSGEPTELGWWAGRVAKAWPELMNRLGYTRYVAQGGDVGAAVTDAMGRLAPEGLVGIHTNLLVPALGGSPMPGNTDEEKAALAQAGTFNTSGRRLLPGAGHAAADDRVRTAGLTGGHGRLDARPRHRQLLQDREGVRRRPAHRQSHPGPHPRQHHAVLADGHRGVRGTVVLGERAGTGRCRRGRPGSSARGHRGGRLHRVPGRNLRRSAHLGRAWLSEPHLLQQGRQGRALRRVGGAGDLHDRGPRVLQVRAMKANFNREPVS